MTRGGRRHNFEFVLLLCDQRVSRPRVQNMVMKSNPRVLFVGHDSADATLLELVLVRDLPSAEVVHIGDPVALGREIERSSFDLVVCDEGLDWMDSNLVLLARIDHRFGNEGDFGRPERFSESFSIDPVQVE